MKGILIEKEDGGQRAELKEIDEVVETAKRLLEGQVRGRVVVDVNA